MLVDEVDITLKAGHGGPGRASFFPGFKSGPDGGNGGRGGDVYIRATTDLFALNRFSREKLVAAENGEVGGKNQKTGGDGKDIEIQMPVGTYLLDKITGEEFELLKPGEVLLICKGGIGGKGTAALASPRNTTPKVAQKGKPGQERDLKVHLKLIADFGLIGLPNSGKSSLLNELTAASAKVADYPFTTLEPNLGVVSIPSTPSGRSGQNKVLADIPGLIEGAAEGKGLGVRFLKHIEKVGLLLHTVPADSEDPAKVYKVVRDEMGKYNPELLSKEEIILLTKSDLLDEKQLKKKIKNLNKLKRQIIPVSIYDFDSIEKLKKVLFSQEL